MLPKHVRYQAALHPEAHSPSLTGDNKYCTQTRGDCQAVFLKNLAGGFCEFLSFLTRLPVQAKDQSAAASCGESGRPRAMAAQQQAPISPAQPA